MLNVITVWGVLGAVGGAAVAVIVTIGTRLIAIDRHWFLVRMRWWLVLIGAVIGFFIGASSEKTSAQFSDAASYLKRAETSYIRHNYTNAISEYSKALTINPHLASAYYGRGLARYGKGDGHGAFADFTRAIELDQNKI
jgi:tetratricopeptide (TPR) repeat protein